MTAPVWLLVGLGVLLALGFVAGVVAVLFISRLIVLFLTYGE